MRTQAWYLMAAVLLLAAGSDLAMAAEAAGSQGGLPYEGWLRSLQKSLTGPVAFSVSLIGIVSCGATLILAGGEIGKFMRSLIYIVLVMTLLIGANSLMTGFFNGASLGDEAVLKQQLTAASASPEQSQDRGRALMHSGTDFRSVSPQQLSDGLRFSRPEQNMAAGSEDLSLDLLRKRHSHDMELLVRGLRDRTV